MEHDSSVWMRQGIVQGPQPFWSLCLGNGVPYSAYEALAVPSFSFGMMSFAVSRSCLVLMVVDTDCTMGQMEDTVGIGGVDMADIGEECWDVGSLEVFGKDHCMGGISVVVPPAAAAAAVVRMCFVPRIG